MKSVVENTNHITAVRKATRVFYINTGNMPSAKARAHLEQVKQDIMATADTVFHENFFIATGDESSVEVFYP